VRNATDWSEELLGLGWLYDPFTLNDRMVMIIPEQSEKEANDFMFQYFNGGKIYSHNDTLVINPQLLVMDGSHIGLLVHEKSPIYRIHKLFFGVHAFIKLKGHEVLSELYFYKSYPQHRSRKFEYTFWSQQDAFGVNSLFAEFHKNGFYVMFQSVHLENTTKYYVLFLLNDSDRTVANQFINASIETKMRYFDWSKNKSCLDSEIEDYRILVFNRQIYEYNNCHIHIEGLRNKMEGFFKYHPNWIAVQDPKLITLLKSKKPKEFSGYLYGIKALRLFDKGNLE
jgi:hypothetical protein